jgi:hypothetical protein
LVTSFTPPRDEDLRWQSRPVFVQGGEAEHFDPESKQNVYLGNSVERAMLIRSPICRVKQVQPSVTLRDTAPISTSFEQRLPLTDRGAFIQKSRGQAAELWIGRNTSDNQENNPRKALSFAARSRDLSCAK